MACGARVMAAVDWADVVGMAERGSQRSTGREGHRGFGILHGATALQLGCRDFHALDGRQRRLAKSEGFVEPP
jgi:hypothetical protein